MNGPFEGLKVVEMGTFVAAPSCARFFADFGAEVVKVESKAGDLIRFNGVSEGRLGSPYENTTFDLENAHKKDLVVNLKAPEGREVLFKLLSETDIFITSWRPQALAKLGLGYENLKDQFPRLIYASFTGYGETGPDCDLPGYDFTAFWARGGLMGSLMQKGEAPMNLAAGIGDHTSGYILAAGILTALYNREKTGKGDYVTTSLFQVSAYLQGMTMQCAQYKDLGQSYPISRKTAENPFNNAYKTKDGRWIQLSMPPFDIFYPRFMPLIGREDLVGNPRYTMDNITENHLHEEFINIIDEAFEKKTTAEWLEILKKADIPHSLCQTWEEVLEDEQAWAIGVFEEFDYPISGKRTMLRLPIHLKNNPKPPMERAPYLGEHSEEILKGMGYTDEQMKEMHEKGIYNTWDDLRERCGGQKPDLLP